MIAALRDGWQLAAGFNPLVSIVGSAIAAVLLTRSRGRAGTFAAIAVLVGAWLLGDGIAVALQAQAAWVADTGSAPGAAAASGAGSDAATARVWVPLALWACGGFALGYALPAWAGAFVGRRVTWGTGWASAAVVAATVSGLATAIGGGLGS